MTGKRFGRLLVVGFAGLHPKTRTARWTCACDCGGAHVATGVTLRVGHVRSCGCLHADSVSRSQSKTAKIRDLDALIADRRAGLTLDQLAAKYRVGASTAEKLLRAAGVSAGRRPTRIRDGGRLLTVEERKQLIEEYEVGTLLVRDIAAKFRITSTAVSGIVRRDGGQVRPVGTTWKGRRTIDPNGYIRISLSREDPWHGSMASANNSVLEHRLVMAKILERTLLPGETVHHVNGDRADNRPENLQLRQGKHGRGVAMSCLDCGSHRIAPRLLDPEQHAKPTR